MVTGGGPYLVGRLLATTQKQSARAGDDGVGLRHHRVDQLESSALTGDRGVDAHRCQRGGPKQVDGEPRGLELGIAGVAFEDVAEDAADVVAADRLAPRAPSDGLRHEGVAVGDEECRRSAARSGDSAARSWVVIATDDIGLASATNSPASV